MSTIEKTAKSERAEVIFGFPIYNQVAAFLIREAHLLDHRLLNDWAKTLAEDLVYFVPVRVTRRVQDFNHEFAITGHFDDDYASMLVRVDRLVNTTSAWSEDPASRVRRFVSNIMVYETDTPDEYEVVSYLLLTRNRADARDYKHLSAERHDRLRWVGDRFLLTNRKVLLDQVVLGMPNLAIFL